MDKKVIAAAGIVILAAVLAVIVIYRPEKGLRTKKDPHPFPKLKVKQPEDPKKRRDWQSPLKRNVDKLEITRKGETVVLKRVKPSDKKNDVGDWEMESPVKYPANKYQVRSLINRLERLEFWEVITRNSSDFKDLQVDDQTGTRLRVFAGTELLADMVVGKSVTAKMEGRSQAYTAVRAHGSRTVWKLGGSVSYIFNKELERWRDDTIVKKKRDDITAIVLQDADGSLLAAKRDPDEKDRTKRHNNWVLLASNPGLDSLDQSELGRIASSASNLRAKGFDDKPDIKNTGLDKPVRRITMVYRKESAKPKPARPAAKPAGPGEAQGKAEPREEKGSKEPARAGAKGSETGTRTVPRGGRSAPRSARSGTRSGRSAPRSGRSAPRSARSAPEGRSSRRAAAPGKARGAQGAKKPAEEKPAPAASGTAKTSAGTGIADVDALIDNPDYETVVVLVGKENKKEKAHYVQVVGNKTVFLVRSSTIQNMVKKVVDFKDKTVLSAKPDDIVGIEVDKEGKKTVLKKDGKEWKAAEPKGLDLDKAGVDRVLKVLENRFKARSFSDTDDPKKTGLDKPTGTIRILLKDKKVVELRVGKEMKRGQWYLQVKGKPDVYVMSSYPLTQLYKEPDKWKKIQRPKRPGGPGMRTRPGMRRFGR